MIRLTLTDPKLETPQAKRYIATIEKMLNFEVEQRRLPASVTDAEVAEVAVGLAATMLGDVRALRSARFQCPIRPSHRTLTCSHCSRCSAASARFCRIRASPG